MDGDEQRLFSNKQIDSNRSGRPFDSRANDFAM